MTTIRRDSELTPIQGFARGVNNVDGDIANDELRAAVNVDLSPEGKPRRRAGYTRLLAGTRVSSLFGHREFPHLLARIGQDLVVLQGAELLEEVIADELGFGAASYATLNGEVCWTVEGQATGRVNADLEVDFLGVPTPQLPNLSAIGDGGLDAGDYQVAITYRSASGEESGATTARTVRVADNGAILLQLPDPPMGVDAIGLYRSECNGSALYFVGEVMAGIAEYLLTQATVGAGLETQHLRPLPPGHLLRMLNGVAWIAVGNQVYHGTPGRPFLHHPGHQRLPLQARIDVMEPVGEGQEAGMFVCAGKRTHWLSGGGHAEKMSIRTAYPHGAVPGTGLVVPASVFGAQYTGLAAYWMADNGVPCLGLPGGTVTPLTENTVSMHRFERGASLLREIKGVRQVITAGRGGEVGAFAASDQVEVTQYRNGIPVP